jgi:AcrR family transcriptional regulator
VGGPGRADAIVAAAQRLIAERGREKLRLSAVAEAAGVSRQTLYRWFPTKDELLAAITVREKDLFGERLRAVLEPHRRPVERLDVALRFMVTYMDESMGAEAIGVDAEFALRSLAAALEPQTQLVVDVLGDALEQVPAVQAGRLSRVQAAGLLLRLAISHYLLPHPDPELLLAEIRAFAGLPAVPSRLAR